MLFGLENLSSHTTKEVVPWEYQTQRPLKTAWSEPSLHHCFYSGFQGSSPTVRVGKENPPVLCHAIVADYDSPAEGKDLVDLVHKRCKGVLPAWVGLTCSNGVRVVWLLEQPMPIQPALAKAFLKHLQKRLGVAKLFAGLDQPAFTDPHKYYEVGHSWCQVSNKVIDHALATQWLVEATTGHDWKKEDIQIPMKDVADRIQKQYPGKWTGPVEIGARGPRFWDSSADNTTAAVIRESGMQCFTGLQAFVPWKQILGAEWASRYQSEKVGGSISSIWHDGQNYWIDGKGHGYRACNRADTMSHLKVNLGLSSRADKSGASEAETAIVRIQEIQAVAGAVKLPCKPIGLVHTMDGRFLNTCDRQVCQPADHVTAEDMDLTKRFLEHLAAHRPEQFYHLLAWIQHFYRSGYELDLQPGQTLFLCGPTEVGKTLFSTVLLSGLMGGHMDASDYLTGGTDWNSELIQRAVWTVDDAAALQDRQSYARWNSQLKKMAANRTFTVHEKYRKSLSVGWAGRVVVTLNNDPESMRVLPDLDISNTDKVMMIRTSDDAFDFPEDAAEQLRAELPYFARFLLDWEPPADVLTKGRYKVRSYIDPTLGEEARTSASSHSFLELIATWFEGLDIVSEVTGSSTDILAKLADETSPVCHLARKYTPVAAGRELGKISSSYPHLVAKANRLNKGRAWVISPKIRTHDAEEN